MIKKSIIFALTILTFYACSSAEKVVVKKKPVKRNAKVVALTFDDLPFATNNEFLSDEEKKKLFNRTLDILKKENIKITGFLIGNKYDSSWFPYLKRFVQEGHTLGNHTFSHFNSNEHTAEEYIANVAKCDSLLENIMRRIGKELNIPIDAPLITQEAKIGKEKKALYYPSPLIKNKKKINKLLTAEKEELEKLTVQSINTNWKYFRYPYLNRGDTKQKKFMIMSAMENMGYKISPVTITSNDWRFNPRFEIAYLNGDEQDMKELKRLYLNRIKRELFNSEDYSEVTFHRPVKHTMLFHLNVINSILLEDIIKLLRDSGYDFISVDEALTDEIYQMADGYKGSYGVPWLYRA
ncbi:MAG: hypothetical protein D6830_03090, partial [Ignavibacteria bacterium]